MEVYTVWFESRLLGTVFHGVYESEALAVQEAERMEKERSGIEYFVTNMPMNSYVEA